MALTSDKISGWLALINGTSMATSPAQIQTDIENGNVTYADCNQIVDPKDVKAIIESDLLIGNGESRWELKEGHLFHAGIAAPVVSPIPEAATNNSLTRPTTSVTNIDTKDIVLEQELCLFGYDFIQVGCNQLAPNSLIVSESISLPPCDWIELSADVLGGIRSSLEFSILDGAGERPILLTEQTEVSYERIFPGLPLRFNPDTNGVAIFRDGIQTELTIVQARNGQETGLAARYKPTSGWKITPQGPVRVKIVLRLYDETDWPQCGTLLLRAGRKASGN